MFSATVALRRLRNGMRSEASTTNEEKSVRSSLCSTSNTVSEDSEAPEIGHVGQGQPQKLRLSKWEGCPMTLQKHEIV